MSIGRAAKEAKIARKETGMTQLEMELDGVYVTREAISQQERGEYKVQPNVSRYFAERHNNPFVAFEAASEYIGWGPQKLDGEAVDLNRATVLIKTEEELEEAVTAINEATRKITKNPSLANEFDKQVIEKSIQEVIDVITAANHYVAILCKEYGISWSKMWTQHKLKLIQRRFLKRS